MLSLSIFSSSQRISVALYEKKNLKLYEKKKISSNKIDSIFLLIKKILGKKMRKIDKIFFSSGPGSFTAIRSIKAIAQGLSIVSKARIISVSDFEIYLSNLNNTKDNVIVFFPNFKNYFYQYFKFRNNRFEPCSNRFHGQEQELVGFIKEKKRIEKEKNLIITSNEIEYKLIANIINSEEFIGCKPDAKKIAEAVFSGYGSDNLEISYHHTYYE